MPTCYVSGTLHTEHNFNNHCSFCRFTIQAPVIPRGKKRFFNRKQSTFVVSEPCIGGIEKNKVFARQISSGRAQVAKRKLDKSGIAGLVAPSSIAAEEQPCHVPKLPHFVGLPKYDLKVSGPAVDHAPQWTGLSCALLSPPLSIPTQPSNKGQAFSFATVFAFKMLVSFPSTAEVLKLGCRRIIIGGGI